MDIYELFIQSGNKSYKPATEEGVVWETNRVGQPGKLTFGVVQDEVLKFEEGDPVIFRKDGKNVFFGFIFTMDKTSDNIVKVTAYDQLRYLKNKDTYVYTNRKASDVIKMIARDFSLNTGSIADTGYVISSRCEDNKTLLDIIYSALDLTLISRRKMYVLYDDFGKLTLKDVETMKVPIVVGELTAQDFSYKSSIDTDTYNRIKLYRDNEDTGRREVYIAQDSRNINKWGVLQHFDKVDEGTNAKAKAESLLKLKNKPTKTFQVKDALGDTRVRAGSSVMTYVKNVGIKQFMLVEKCKHTFGNNEHFMTLDLRGNI